jgi:hypothetical protein
MRTRGQCIISYFSKFFPVPWKLVRRRVVHCLHNPVPTFAKCSSNAGPTCEHVPCPWLMALRWPNLIAECVCDCVSATRLTVFNSLSRRSGLILSDVRSSGTDPRLSRPTGNELLNRVYLLTRLYHDADDVTRKRRMGPRLVLDKTAWQVARPMRRCGLFWRLGCKWHPSDTYAHRRMRAKT